MKCYFIFISTTAALFSRHGEWAPYGHCSCTTVAVNIPVTVPVNYNIRVAIDKLPIPLASNFLHS